jgi:hypothetical protein
MSVVATLNPPLWLQDLTYPARIDRQLMEAMWIEGVVSGLGLRQRAEGANLSVDVAAGYALVEGDDQTGQGSYLLSLDGKVNVPLDTADTSSRVDLLILRVNDPQAGGPNGNSGTLEYVKGTPGSASPAALPTSAIELGRITVGANATSITNAVIDTTLRGRSGPRSVAGLLLALGLTAAGADYARSPTPQAVSPETGSLAFTLAERSIVRFDAHVTAYGTQGKSVAAMIKLNQGTAAITDASVEVAYARDTFAATGSTGSVSPRPWAVRVLEPGSFRVGFWAEGSSGINYSVSRSKDRPELVVTNMGPTSRPATFP